MSVFGKPEQVSESSPFVNQLTIQVRFAINSFIIGFASSISSTKIGWPVLKMNVKVSSVFILVDKLIEGTLSVSDETATKTVHSDEEGD